MSIAAIPETYATAWTCLFHNIEITKGQSKGAIRDIEPIARRPSDTVPISEPVRAASVRGGGSKSRETGYHPDSAS
jgi:hypothetical protein